MAVTRGYLSHLLKDREHHKYYIHSDYGGFLSQDSAQGTQDFGNK